MRASLDQASAARGGRAPERGDQRRHVDDPMRRDLQAGDGAGRNRGLGRAQRRVIESLARNAVPGQGGCRFVESRGGAGVEGDIDGSRARIGNAQALVEERLHESVVPRETAGAQRLQRQVVASFRKRREHPCGGPAGAIAHRPWVEDRDLRAARAQRVRDPTADDPTADDEDVAHELVRRVTGTRAGWSTFAGRAVDEAIVDEPAKATLVARQIRTRPAPMRRARPARPRSTAGSRLPVRQQPPAGGPPPMTAILDSHSTQGAAASGSAIGGGGG